MLNVNPSYKIIAQVLYMIVVTLSSTLISGNLCNFYGSRFSFNLIFFMFLESSTYSKMWFEESTGTFCKIDLKLRKLENNNKPIQNTDL